MVPVMRVIEPLRRSVLSSLLASSLMATFPAAGAPRQIQPGLLEQILGKWLIISFDLAPISAVSTEEAQAFVGKAAEFRPDKVVFGPLKCGAPVYKEVRPGSQETGSVDIVIACKTDEIVPNLSYDRRSRRLVAELDGATYRLSRGSP
jgi:hypothetical protein